MSLNVVSSARSKPLPLQDSFRKVVETATTIPALQHLLQKVNDTAIAHPEAGLDKAAVLLEGNLALQVAASDGNERVWSGKKPLTASAADVSRSTSAQEVANALRGKALDMAYDISPNSELRRRYTVAGVELNTDDAKKTDESLTYWLRTKDIVMRGGIAYWADTAKAGNEPRMKNGEPERVPPEVLRSIMQDSGEQGFKAYMAEYTKQSFEVIMRELPHTAEEPGIAADVKASSASTSGG